MYILSCVRECARAFSRLSVPFVYRRACCAHIIQLQAQREKYRLFYIYFHLVCSHLEVPGYGVVRFLLVRRTSARFSHSSDLRRYNVLRESSAAFSLGSCHWCTPHSSSHISARSPVAANFGGRFLCALASSHRNCQYRHKHQLFALPFILAMFFGVFSMDAKCFLFACSISLFAAAVLRFSRASVPHKCSLLSLFGCFSPCTFALPPLCSTCGQMAGLRPALLGHTTLLQSPGFYDINALNWLSYHTFERIMWSYNGNNNNNNCRRIRLK